MALLRRHLAQVRSSAELKSQSVGSMPNSMHGAELVESLGRKRSAEIVQSAPAGNSRRPFHLYHIENRLNQ